MTLSIKRDWYVVNLYRKIREKTLSIPVHVAISNKLLILSIDVNCKSPRSYIANIFFLLGVSKIFLAIISL